MTEGATDDRLAALRRGDLAGIRELRLPGVAEFPREVFGLADTLEVLDLGGGALSSLPDDLGRLHRLTALFCSGTRFERLPPVLGDCPALGQVGFRGCGLREVPGEALPPALRWLTLTDNRIAGLPEALGQRPRLQKLMLAGNRLTDLPATLAEAPNLEMLRFAANRLERLPSWILALPRLAWLAWSGNPLVPDLDPPPARGVSWRDLAPAELLGEGASGRVFRAAWRDGERTRPVALKLFKGAMTSDGLPEHEMEASLAAGAHPGLLGAHGRVVDHPEDARGLVLPLAPAGWRALAGPPDLASCSRDVYDPDLRLDVEAVRGIARTVGAAAAHLHRRGWLHGDLYAHNVLWDGTRHAVLSDFGAASRLPDDAVASAALTRIEVRAFGLLLGELLDRCPPGHAHGALRALAERCAAADVMARPPLEEVVAAL